MFSDIRRAVGKTDSVEKGIELGALAEMRPVVMACAAAGLGLLPGALSTGIGVQPQQPSARVVVGGMITSPLAILFLLPLLASFFLQAEKRNEGKA
jgi:cobalt-zinc-cadmium resistance protein CzcA